MPGFSPALDLKNALEKIKKNALLSFNEEYDNCPLSFEHIENYDVYIESRKN